LDPAMSAKGHVRKTIVLTIGGTAYQCEITGATVTPTADVQTTKVLCPDGSASDTGPVSWALDVNYLVDHNAGSLFRLLVASHGQTATFDYEPDPDTAPGVKWTGNLRIIAGPAGGDAATWESGSVSLPIIGTPTITDPLPAVASDEPAPVS
jgi:hypothetical protein